MQAPEGIPFYRFQKKCKKLFIHAIFPLEGASLGCMSYICKVFTILSSLLLMSCSSLDMTDKKLVYEFEPEWGAAYYIGDEGESSRYRLLLTAGRIDENENLISGGASLTLMLNAPLSDMLPLPDGRYMASPTKGTVYTFNYGITLDGNAVEGSYVTAKLPGSKEIKTYPVDGGEVLVEISEQGEYEIKAEIQASALRFDFEYEGNLKTYDLDL